jgi:hypothetical protein
MQSLQKLNILYKMSLTGLKDIDLMQEFKEGENI